jgi:hypothetical protein
MTLPDATDLDAVEEIRTAPRGSGCRQIWRAERGLGGVVQRRGIRPPVWRRRRRCREAAVAAAATGGGGRDDGVWMWQRRRWRARRRLLEVAASRRQQVCSVRQRRRRLKLAYPRDFCCFFQGTSFAEPISQRLDGPAGHNLYWWIWDVRLFHTTASLIFTISLLYTIYWFSVGEGILALHHLIAQNTPNIYENNKNHGKIIKEKPITGSRGHQYRDINSRQKNYILLVLSW